MIRKLFISLVLIMVATAAWAAREHATSGTVNSVNKSSGKVNISHGPIKTLGMDGMTMDFLVEDPAMLDELKKGAAIDFSVTKDSKGVLVITDFEITGMSTASSGDGHGDHHHSH